MFEKEIEDGISNNKGLTDVMVKYFTKHLYDIKIYACNLIMCVPWGAVLDKCKKHNINVCKNFEINYIFNEK